MKHPSIHTHQCSGGVYPRRLKSMALIDQLFFHTAAKITVKSFQITRLQLFEMIDELFADTKVISHHEKLFIRKIRFVRNAFAGFMLKNVDPKTIVTMDIGHYCQRDSDVLSA